MRKKGLLLCTMSGVLFYSYYNIGYAHSDTKVGILTVANKQPGVVNNTNLHNKEIAIEAEGYPLTITMHGESISGFYAFSARNGGSISATGVHAVAGQVGLLAQDGRIDLKNSTITIKRGAGIVFFQPQTILLERYNTNAVTLTNTKLFVESGVGILGPFADGSVTLQNSEVRADVLVKNKARPGNNNATLILTADNSTLEGGTRLLRQESNIRILQQSAEDVAGYHNSKSSISSTALQRKIIFNLHNGSKWILRASKTETNAKDHMLGPVRTSLILDIATRSYSDLSVLNLSNSAVVFESPTEGHYQTLYVGSGTDGREIVYNAKGHPKLFLNAQWSDDKKISEQKADHLLIKGDVTGSTTVYVNVYGDPTDAPSVRPLNQRGISLIQVSGQAAESSFKLANGYTTIHDSPYKYVLNAYGPTSRNGLADIKQKLPGVLSDVNPNNNDFWDFRLQNQYLPNSNIKALVPQMANYLVMPNALFSAGFTDIENQNTLLANIRTMPWEMKSNKKNSFFLSSYGNKATLSSNRTALEYSYGADISYGAIQTGVALAALEGQSTSSYFGLLGTYGKLSFTPQNMADVKKTTLNKWTFTAYSSIQHNDGVYVNMLLSYGLLRGNISNAIIGQTASVDDAKTWGASATLGKQLATSIEGLVFEPQTQIAYQQLMFRTIKDVDKFKVDMGSPYQWSARMGGRLVKNVNQFEDGRTLSFYGKLNLISIFGDGGTIQAGKRNFQLDPIGSAIEGGIGFNAELIQNVTFHGDITYQQKLQKAGLSGAIFSGTLRYRF
ncbi:autotransporter outer membrane beta-barrel domain-containing protein [Bartonella sp. WD16.2]|uniref:autotransporter outer membrane beta-barrel domain-containing protein n=1 Tax=Bartonella sp. WD16.2 TaxID=1933904 RepID=UPI0009994E75|nr:autotransporter outer membrane beta-barrel domain-containing protein [Bartonella sp. WD16.2]AQX20283.1 outer membrane autotransporter barrel domain-containing protein [Bartonella sp. WD16.2]